MTYGAEIIANSPELRLIRKVGEQKRTGKGVVIYHLEGLHDWRYWYRREIDDN